MGKASCVWEYVVDGIMSSRRGLIILEEDGERAFAPRELVREALRVAGGLARLGVQPGDRVGIMAQTTPHTVLAFLGCWAAGAVAVPLPLPMRAVDPASFMEQSRRRLEKVGARILALPGTFVSLVSGMEGGFRLVAMEDLAAGEEAESVRRERGDIALVQFTSGSTSEPRGVILTHGNILDNAGAIAGKVNAGPWDTVVSWMPLYHDMGLIGFLITALGAGCSLVLMSPQRFVADPSLWLRACGEYRATITGGPNFAYALSTRVLRSGGLAGTDLSSLRLALNGAEPIDSQVLDELVEAGADNGLRPEVPYPVYGLAEATLAVTFPEPGKVYHKDHVSRRGIEESGQAIPCEPDSEDARCLVALGRPLPGLEVRVIKEDGSPAGEREVGEVCVRGSSVMQGYWGDAAATAEALRGGWLHTGDLGYLSAGELYLVGRIKDMVIIGGRNLFPEDVEHCAERVEGMRKGNAVAFGVTTKRGRERLVLVGETRLSCPQAALKTARAVSYLVREEIGVPVREVVLVPAGTLPKTSSGKKRRFLCRELYLGEKLQAIARSGAPVMAN